VVAPAGPAPVFLLSARSGVRFLPWAARPGSLPAAFLNLAKSCARQDFDGAHFVRADA